MGLDVVLGLVVLLAALRGWFRGFLLQAIRLGGLVSCVYLATPVRDLARPLAREHLVSIGPGLLDKLLWWAAAVTSYVVLTGVATWLVQAFRRRPFAGPRPVGPDGAAEWPAKPSFWRRPYAEARYGDQSAGALLGAAKGLLVVAFLAAGIEHYAPEYRKDKGWVGEQIQTSRVLAWSFQHHPAQRIWESPPVQTFVGHVRRMGLQDPAEEPKPPAGQAEDPGVQTASRPRPLSVPPPADHLDPSAPGFDLDEALDAVRDELSKPAKPR